MKKYEKIFNREESIEILTNFGQISNRKKYQINM